MKKTKKKIEKVGYGGSEALIIISTTLSDSSVFTIPNLLQLLPQILDFGNI